MHVFLLPMAMMNALGCVVNFFQIALKMTLLGKVGGEAYASYAQKTRSPRLKRQMKITWGLVLHLEV